MYIFFKNYWFDEILRSFSASISIRLFLVCTMERADIHIKSLCYLNKRFEAWLRTVGTPLAHGGGGFTQFVCQPLDYSLPLSRLSIVQTSLPLLSLLHRLAVLLFSTNTILMRLISFFAISFHVFLGLQR